MPDQSPFIWHELVTADQPTSGAFFSELFGWTRKKVDAGPFGTYTLFQMNGQDVAGMIGGGSARRNLPKTLDSK